MFYVLNERKKVCTWHDVPDFIPISGSVFELSTKHLGIIPPGVQAGTPPHIHNPVVSISGVSTFPFAVHQVLSDDSHLSVLVTEQTHVALVLTPEHIGFKSSHPRCGASAAKSLLFRSSCFLVHGTHSP